MMLPDLGPHAGLIIAAYVSGAVIIGGLALWAMLDERRQERLLIELEARGARRRSARAFSGDVGTGSSKEDATKQESRAVIRSHSIGSRSSRA
jgi:heme exporter protein D